MLTSWIFTFELASAWGDSQYISTLLDTIQNHRFIMSCLMLAVTSQAVCRESLVQDNCVCIFLEVDDNEASLFDSLTNGVSNNH